MLLLIASCVGGSGDKRDGSSGSTGSSAGTNSVPSQPSPTDPPAPTPPPVDTDNAPTVQDANASNGEKDTQKIIQLNYTDLDGDLATVCNVSNLSNITVTQACACDGAGICTVGMTGTNGYTGNASFQYNVTANGKTSNTANITYFIAEPTTSPLANDIIPPSFNEDTQSIITLDYTDSNGDLATACNLSSLINISISTACTCDVAGTCTVGVTGDTNYFGNASFSYTVTAGGEISNAANASLTINPVDDAPVASFLLDITANQDQEEIFTLTYTDIENDDATSCAVTNLANATITSPCSCGGGVCTVGLTGTSGFSGIASFEYTVTANALQSNTESVSYTIDPSASAFVTVWEVSDNQTVTLPLRDGFTYDFEVNWGDGTPAQRVTSSTDPNRSHTYANDIPVGTQQYTVTIEGTVEAFYFNNGGSKDSLISVTALGSVGWVNLENAFKGCANLTLVQGGNTAKVVDMSGMFQEAVSVDVDASTWNFRKVLDMTDMFTGVTLPTASYSTIIERAYLTTVEKNVTLDGGDSLYSADVAFERGQLISKEKWTINDGGQE